MRCLVLAEALKAEGWNCLFATEEESYDFVPAIRGYERIDPDEFYNTPIESDLLVVDHYDLDIEYEAHMRPHTSIIMVIDDKANRKHDCDIVLDQTYGRLEKEYTGDVPESCHILTGSLYALLRPEFSGLRNEALDRRKDIQGVKRILLNFGGNDQKNMILESLKKLHDIGYKETIDVVFGFQAPHRESVEAYAAEMPNTITYHENVDMAQLMADVDFAIGAPSVTSWERACLGLPSLLLLTADVQKFCLDTLYKDQVIIGKTLDQLDLPGVFVDFDRDTYLSYVERNTKISDGLGVQRVIDIVKKEVDQNYDILKEVSRA